MTEQEIARALRGNILVLSGAGISVASGLPTFTGNEGLYHGLNPYELASPDAFQRHPLIVWNWYFMRIREGYGAKPNPAHYALAELEQIAEKVTIITSNVDPLHQRAGSTRVLRLHGDILETKCTRCDEVRPLDLTQIRERASEHELPYCLCGGLLRPNVVWFGESPWRKPFDVLESEHPEFTLVLEVGMSGIVTYHLSELMAEYVPVIRINPEATGSRGIYPIAEPAEEALPRLVAAARATLV